MPLKNTTQSVASQSSHSKCDVQCLSKVPLKVLPLKVPLGTTQSVICSAPQSLYSKWYIEILECLFKCPLLRGHACQHFIFQLSFLSKLQMQGHPHHINHFIDSEVWASAFGTSLAQLLNVPHVVLTCETPNHARIYMLAQKTWMCKPMEFACSCKQMWDVVLSAEMLFQKQMKMAHPENCLLKSLCCFLWKCKSIFMFFQDAINLLVQFQKGQNHPVGGQVGVVKPGPQTQNNTSKVPDFNCFST